MSKTYICVTFGKRCTWERSADSKQRLWAVGQHWKRSFSFKQEDTPFYREVSVSPQLFISESLLVSNVFPVCKYLFSQCKFIVQKFFDLELCFARSKFVLLEKRCEVSFSTSEKHLEPHLMCIWSKGFTNGNSWSRRPEGLESNVPFFFYKKDCKWKWRLRHSLQPVSLGSLQNWNFLSSYPLVSSITRESVYGLCGFLGYCLTVQKTLVIKSLLMKYPQESRIFFSFFLILTKAYIWFLKPLLNVCNL